MLLKATQQFDVLSVEGRDAEGNVAPLEDLQFTVSPPEIGHYVPADPGDTTKVGTFIADKPGTGQLSFMADGVIGPDGSNQVTGVLDLEITPGDAVTGIINVGPVQDS